LIEFADGPERFSHLAVMFQSFAYLGNLRRAEAQLARLTAGVLDIEHPEGMPFAAGALGATAGVMNGALERRTAQDIAQIREPDGEFVAGLDRLLACRRQADTHGCFGQDKFLKTV
jgi:hypothetical protein